MSTRLQVDVKALLVRKAQSTALAEARGLASVTAHVGHQQQGRPEALPTLRTLQHPLVSAAMSFQVFFSVKPLAALQTPDFVPFGVLIAPTTRVLFVLLEVVIVEELSKTRHAVNALRFALVSKVQPRQPKVTPASDARVRQQTQVRETVLQQIIFLRKN